MQGLFVRVFRCMDLLLVTMALMAEPLAVQRICDGNDWSIPGAEALARFLGFFLRLTPHD